MKIRVKLYSKNRPKSEQNAVPITIEIADDAKTFDYDGRTYKITWLQNSVHEFDVSGSVEAEAVEC